MQSSPAQLPQSSSSQAEQSIEQQAVPSPSKNPRYNLRYTLSGHRQSISSLKFSPDGSILASAGAVFMLSLKHSLILNNIGGKVRTN